VWRAYAHDLSSDASPCSGRAAWAVAARTGRVSPGAGLAATAQLGIPAAVATLGLAEGALSGEIVTAIIAASIISLIVCTIGVDRLVATSLGSTSTLAR
jgi:hypothetical protein